MQSHNKKEVKCHDEIMLGLIYGPNHFAQPDPYINENRPYWAGLGWAWAAPRVPEMLLMSWMRGLVCLLLRLAFFLYPGGGVSWGRGGMKKELLASAPWRGEEDTSDKFADAKLRATNQPGGTPTMHVPGKRRAAASKTDEELEAEIDPELRYSFQRNFQVIPIILFSFDPF